jgi:molybdopterin-synthase adenylyltransferase
MTIRIVESQWTALCEQMFVRKDVETAGLLLGKPIETATGTVIAIKEAFVLPDSAYRIRRIDQISLDPVALNRLTRRARDQGWSVVTIHTHPGATEPWFSSADDAGDARLMPSLDCQIPEAPHGSVVLVENGQAIARVFDKSAVAHEVSIHVVGRTLRQTLPAVVKPERWFARQELALGAYGQGQLKGLRIGVVGLGGIGSIVSLQLAHLGIGELILIDGDIVEASNLSRIAGATKADVGKVSKAEVAARYAKSLGLVRSVEHRAQFLDQTHAALLASCDIIVSCVDRHTPRALLNRLAYECHVPVIDLGTAFRVDASGTMTGDAGRVVVIGPGRPCLGCWGHLDPHALRVEALSPEERESEVQAGYIDGAVEAQPSVVAFNTFVAGAGVCELLRIATAFAGTESPPLRMAFSFADGTVRRNVIARNPECSICGAL